MGGGEEGGDTAAFCHMYFFQQPEASRSRQLDLGVQVGGGYRLRQQWGVTVL